MASFPLEQPSAAPAFERLYRRHVGEVYRYASAVLRNPADAEDVVQTTFLNAFRAFEQGQRPQRPLSWLMAIARNVCRQRFRQQSSRPSEVALDDDLASPAVEEEAAARAEDIRRALSQLGFNQRTALVMRELEGRSYAEIAVRLELSHSAVETLVFRARRALREQLEDMLTCSEAERAISRQLDALLTRQERGALRAHLRSCSECRSLARRMRGRRSGIRALGVLPLPGSLAGFSASGSGVASVGARAVLLKLAGATTAMLVAAGAGYETAHTLARPDARAHSAPTGGSATVMQAPNRASPASRLAGAIEAPRRPHVATIARERISAPRTVTIEAHSAPVTPPRTRAGYEPPAAGPRHPSSSHGRPPGSGAVRRARPQHPSSSPGRPAGPPAGSPAPAAAASDPPSQPAASCRRPDDGGLPLSAIETAESGCPSQAPTAPPAIEKALPPASGPPAPVHLGGK